MEATGPISSPVEARPEKPEEAGPPAEPTVAGVHLVSPLAAEISTPPQEGKSAGIEGGNGDLNGQKRGGGSETSGVSASLTEEPPAPLEKRGEGSEASGVSASLSEEPSTPSLEKHGEGSEASGVSASLSEEPPASLLDTEWMEKTSDKADIRKGSAKKSQKQKTEEIAAARQQKFLGRVARKALKAKGTSEEESAELDDSDDVKARAVEAKIENVGTEEYEAAEAKAQAKVVKIHKPRKMTNLEAAQKAQDEIKEYEGK